MTARHSLAKSSIKLLIKNMESFPLILPLHKSTNAFLDDLCEVASFFFSLFQTFRPP